MRARSGKPEPASASCHRSLQANFFAWTQWLYEMIGKAIAVYHSGPLAGAGDDFAGHVSGVV